jgi:hypothetical protein
MLGRLELLAKYFHTNASYFLLTNFGEDSNASRLLLVKYKLGQKSLPWQTCIEKENLCPSLHKPNAEN